MLKAPFPQILRPSDPWEDWSFPEPTIFQGKVENFLAKAPAVPMFDLIVSSPPYNMGKEYEQKKSLAEYMRRQSAVIKQLRSRLKPGGSICWQVGNFVTNNEVVPLDIEFHKIFRKLSLTLRNRIIWHFGHGLHSKRRFSGRYEVVLWYTCDADYTFNLDAVRIDSKYPAKRHYKGEKKGEYSGHPNGKNPEDVWSIPNVKGNHVEKTSHPCQFPVGLVERLVLALTNEGDLVFDPYCGVASAGVAALAHGRRFVGCEPLGRYVTVGKGRLARTLKKLERYRPHDRPIYDHTKSKLSIRPQR